MAVKILPAGEACVFVEFGDTISRELSARVTALKSALEYDLPRGVVELVPTYRSLAVYFDPLTVDLPSLKERLKSEAEAQGECRARDGLTVRVPAYFGGELGPDLPDVAAHCHLSEDEVVRRFCASPLYCYMNGFTPGFPYLGGLDESLATPRLRSPRIAIPAGSVAIGGAQAGAYSLASPGGWRIIGRVPFPLYDAARSPSTVIRAGMSVRFYPVSRERYEQIGRDERCGAYRFEYEECER
ncbi:MAG: 5-oxoprolinase subunit PxpB [Pyramidobacter sp.]|nr:5-oxoprolinase subunit PxpB [Pyramidobacter sp.]